MEFANSIHCDSRPHSYSNLLALLRQGGAPKEDVLRHLEERWGVDPHHRRQHLLGERCGVGRPLDHVQLWGKDGIPLFLIGHPYGVGTAGLVTLAGLAALGMKVSIDSETWFGFDTVHVEVYHRETVWAEGEKQARGPAAARPAGGGPSGSRPGWTAWGRDAGQTGNRPIVRTTSRCRQPGTAGPPSGPPSAAHLRAHRGARAPFPFPPTSSSASRAIVSVSPSCERWLSECRLAKVSPGKVITEEPFPSRG